MDLVGTKVLVLVLLGALRLACGLLPLAVTTRLGLKGPLRHGKMEAFISYFLCFGGGVLIATSFIHIIPEVREAMDAIRTKGDSIIPKDSVFPWGELCICAGFFLVYLLEEVVHRLFDAPHEEVRQEVAPAGKTVGKIVPTTSQVHLLVSSLSIDRLAKDSPQVLPPVGGGEEGVTHHHHHHHCRVHDTGEAPTPDRAPQSVAESLRGLLVVVALRRRATRGTCSPPWRCTRPRC
ncbi:uncharacterized protein LOC134541716 [Bacillus rossius redtenbacheri]|uniref:uncharacterized protein LOC134541716 n=1 Tax=Bacillus rossius redtenbacheri TaxID=93214 RepID=UPI002FDC8C70